MPHDAGVAEQPCHVFRPESSDPLRIETGEGGAEVLALPQDRQPAQTGLEAFEADLLEQPPIIHHGTAPLLVVVGDVHRVVAAPQAALSAAAGVDESRGHRDRREGCPASRRSRVSAALSLRSIAASTVGNDGWTDSIASITADATTSRVNHV